MIKTLRGGIQQEVSNDIDESIYKKKVGERKYTCRFGFQWIPTGVTSDPIFNGSTAIVLPYKRLILKKFKSSMDWVTATTNVIVSHRVIITPVGSSIDILLPAYGAPTPAGVTPNASGQAVNAIFERDSSQGSMQEDTVGLLFGQSGFTHQVAVYGNPSPSFAIGDVVTFTCELEFQIVE